MQAGNKKKHRYELSAVMGAWQRGYAIDWTLLTLMNQDEPPDEIIVVDDGSTDNTRSLVERLQHERPEGNIKYFYTNNPEYTTGAYAINCAIKQATKPLVMLTFAEVLHPSPDVRIIKEYFDNPKNDKTMLIAHPLYWSYGTEYNKALRKLYYPDQCKRIPLRDDVVNYHQGYISPDWSITYFPLGGQQHIAGILRKHLMAIRGYDEEFAKHGICGGEDADLEERLQAYGVELVRINDIAIIHLGHENKGRVATKEEDDLLWARREYHKTHWLVNVGEEWGALRE